jgi:hypothetical protein
LTTFTKVMLMDGKMLLPCSKKLLTSLKPSSHLH